MKQKEILEKLKQEAYIEHKKIGYQVEDIFLYESGSKTYADKLSQSQLNSLLNKNLIQLRERTSRTMNGIGGKFMEVIKLEYIIK